MSTNRHAKELFLLAVFLVASFGVIGTGVLIQNNQNTSTTEAASFCKCDDDKVCYPDGCTRKPKTSNNTFDEKRYDKVCEQYLPGWPPSKEYQDFYCSQHQPDCCADMVKYQDARLCCFMERWHCHPNYCKQLQGDTNSCGKYWGLPKGANEYGCVKKDANGDKIPKYGLPPGLPGGNQPTNTPIPPTVIPPTAKPTNPPTPTPGQQAINEPTQPSSNPSNQKLTPGITHFAVNSPTPVRPTKSDNSFALDFIDKEDNTQTNTPQANNQPSEQSNSDTNNPEQSNNPLALKAPQMEFKSPKQILLETVTIQSVQRVNNATQQPLSAAKNTFVTIKTYDQLLETTVENWIVRLRQSFQRLIL